MTFRVIKSTHVNIIGACESFLLRQIKNKYYFYRLTINRIFLNTNALHKF